MGYRHTAYVSQPRKEYIMSWWVQHRDAAEKAIASLWHKGTAILAPVAAQVAAVATPQLEAALLKAGTAVIQAVAEKGIAHGSDDAIAAAKASLLSDVPHLEATVSTALAASVAAQLQQAKAQAADDPGKPPSSEK